MSEEHRVIIDEEYDSGVIGEAVQAAIRLGYADVTVTTVVEPRFEHLPKRCRYYLKAQKPVAVSRALASTRTGR